MVGKTACGQQWSREQKIWQKIKIETSDKSTTVRFESFRPSVLLLRLFLDTTYLVSHVFGQKQLNGGEFDSSSCLVYSAWPHALGLSIMVAVALGKGCSSLPGGQETTDKTPRDQEQNSLTSSS